MSDDLVQFLRTRLDEDAAAAKRVESRWRQIGETGVIVASDGDRAEECANGNWTGIAEHIVRHDPARVLAEVEAKRVLLNDLLSDPHVDVEDQFYSCAVVAKADQNRFEGPCDCGRDSRLLRRLRLLARPFRNHPAFNPAWLED